MLTLFYCWMPISIFYFFSLLKPFYLTQEFWTFAAVIVALSTPWIVEWLRDKPKKSKLEFKGVKIIQQEANPEEYLPVKLLHVGRLIIENKGKYKARLVEAYIDKIIYGGGTKEEFIPMPLSWTHGHLNKNGPSVRDIYPNQVVYLDIFNHFYNEAYLGNSEVIFTVGSGLQYENLSKLNLGQSFLHIKFYQESGQVDELIIQLVWNGTSVPDMFLK